MKYKSIQIYPQKGKWYINKINLEGDRVIKKTKPNSLGFYHFPDSMTFEQGFEELKKCMVERHKKEIKQLQKSLKQLQDLKFIDHHEGRI
jgi:guanylate kinase